jgi:GH35 family endo-1,4-beta-xylanase
LKYLICFLVFFSIQLFGQDNYSIKNIIREYPKDSFFVGGTLNHAELNSKIEKLFLKEFNYLTPENASKQTAIHPSPGVWKWKKHDDFIKFANKNNLKVRIHGPISPQASKWAKNDSRTKEELLTNLEEFFTALCKRVNDEPNVIWMDVVNETVLRNGNWFSEKPGDSSWENPWTQIGFNKDGIPLYIIKAFEIANRYAPNVKLVYNHNGGMEKPMWLKVVDTIEYLRNLGLRVDGLGWQGHLRNKGLDKEDLIFFSQIIDWTHQMGMEFHVTELNFWLRNENPKSLLINNIQSVSYSNIINTLISKRNNGVVTLNHWGLIDKSKSGNFPSYTLSLYDSELNPKQALYSIKKSLIEKRTTIHLIK